MGAFAQAPMRSRHPAARVRNGTTQPADRSNERQQNRVRLTESQTHRVMPYSSSLACGKKRGAHTPTSQVGGNWTCPKERPVDGGLNPARTSRVGESG